MIWKEFVKRSLENIKNKNPEKQYIKVIEKLGLVAKGISENNKNNIQKGVYELAEELIILAYLLGVKDLQWRYKRKTKVKNFLKLSDRIGSIGELILERKLWIKDKEYYHNLVKQEIKKALYNLTDLALEEGIEINFK